MTITDVKIGFQSRLTNIYSLKEIDSMCSLFLEYIGYSKHDLIINGSASLEKTQIELYQEFLNRLSKHEPIQYITEEAYFYGNTFKVSPSVLIPRQETEQLVDILIKQHAQEPDLRLLDMCTGSGCIAISIQLAIPTARVFAADISEQALKIAQENANKHKTAVDFCQCDLLQKSAYTMLPKCSILVSNPPYVRQCEKEYMQKNVLDFEPEIALFVSNENPLVFYHALADVGHAILEKNGNLYCEINEHLGEETKQVFIQSGYSSVSIIQDIHNKNRFIHAIKK